MSDGERPSDQQARYSGVAAQVLERTPKGPRPYAEDGLERVLVGRVVDGEEVELIDGHGRVWHDEAHQQGRQFHERDREMERRPALASAAHRLRAHLALCDRLSPADAL